MALTHPDGSGLDLCPWFRSRWEKSVLLFATVVMTLLSFVCTLLLHSGAFIVKMYFSFICMALSPAQRRVRTTGWLPGFSWFTLESHLEVSPLLILFWKVLLTVLLSTHWAALLLESVQDTLSWVLWPSVSVDGKSIHSLLVSESTVTTKGHYHVTHMVYWEKTEHSFWSSFIFHHSIV